MWVTIAKIIISALLPILEKDAVALLPVVWQALVQSGLLSKAQVDLVTTGEHILTTIEAVKTDPDYNIQKNGATDTQPVAQGQPNSNINQG